MRIGGFPAGLLSLLDAQTFGESPKDLTGVISPTVDLTGMYALSKQLAIPMSRNPNAVGFLIFASGSGPFTVPTAEVWHLKFASIIVQTDPTEQWKGALAIRQNGLVVPLHPMVTVGNATTTEAAPFGYPMDLMIPPGTEFGLYTSEFTGTVVASGQFIVARYRI